MVGFNSMVWCGENGDEQVIQFVLGIVPPVVRKIRITLIYNLNTEPGCPLENARTLHCSFRKKDNIYHRHPNIC